MSSRLDRSSRETSSTDGSWQKEASTEHSSSARSSAAGPRSPNDRRLAEAYANLELPYGADLEQVKEAWKRLMRKYHPDLHSQDVEKQKIATEIVQGLNLAYERLKKHLER